MTTEPETLEECRRILYGPRGADDWLSEVEAHDWLSAEELGSERDAALFDALEGCDG